MNQLNKIQEKEVTRKEFLAILGTGLVSILGFSTILKLLGHKGFGSDHQSRRGYGGGPYGA